jgi:hypothetical protein
MSVSAGKSYKRYHPIVTFFKAHHPARLMYSFLVFIGLNIIAGIIQAFAQSGGLPSVTAFEHTYLVQLTLRYPIIFYPVFLLSITLAGFGWWLEHRAKMHIQEEEAQPNKGSPF